MLVNVQFPYTNKERALSLASFDFLRFWTTFVIQINARKLTLIRERA